MLRLLQFWLTRQQQPRTLYLIRGIAGTGKTTLAEALTPWHCAADMMPGLYNKDGSYNREIQSQSHQWCKDTIERWMEEGKRKIAVHNTFVLNQWIEPYEKLAHQYGYRFQVIHCEGEHGSIHNVPEEMMQKWRETWEPYTKANEITSSTPSTNKAINYRCTECDAFVVSIDGTKFDGEPHSDCPKNGQSEWSDREIVITSWDSGLLGKTELKQKK